ncbi:MAG: cob(I)yrinic acid a,c-diamide adenosyltransferase [Bacteroidales bacterium]|nr:cob(I)yrinic acid a,c-diamide adenosyltransferase [Bacteroidales bacterium]
MIYTKTGDHGTTSLVGGSRVAKDDHRVEAYGTVDELNSHIGLLAEMIRPLQGGYYDELKAVQHNLFTLQTLLATEDETIYARLPQLPEEEVELLERQIDTITDLLPKLQNFVIAGGNLIGAQCHVCRTVCRRAERRVVTLARETIQPSSNQEIKQSTEIILRYLNRLSDYLFVLSRHSVVLDGKKEDLYIN